MVDNLDEDEGGSFTQDAELNTPAEPQEPVNRDSLRDDAFNEGIEEAAIESLADKTDITIDDLRQIPGADKLTDEQLLAEWEKAQAEAGGKEGVSVEAKVELPFPVYDDKGNKLAADKVTLGDLLSGKVQIGYNAMGKEQRKALQDVIRNASQGHWNEHRYNTVNEQYRQAHGKVSALESQVKQYTDRETQWNAALTALVMGNNEPMKALVEAYRGALGKTGITPEGFVAQDAVTAEREATERGQQWYTEVGMPAAIDIASRYNANPKEVISTIKYFIEHEPTLTPARIDEILKFDVPMEFEKHGYTESGRAPTDQNNGSNGESANDVAALKKQIEALSARLADKTNDRTNQVREKGKRTPPAGSGATGGAGDSMPTFKNRADMKEWLQR